jgi:hypothetical protein
MSNWFDTGRSAVDKAMEKGGSGGHSTFRFYMRPESEALIAFVDGDNTDDEPIGHYKEHTFSVRDSKVPGFASCTGPGCDLCKEGLKPYDAWPFTIIQIEPTYKDRDGKEHTNQRKLMIAKKEIMQRILRFIEQRDGLVGSIWKVYRSGPRAYTIGDDWQFMEKVGDRSALAKHLGVDDDRVTPVDYREELAPKTLEELQAAGADFEGTRKRTEEWAKRDDDSGDRRGGRSGGGGGGRGAGVSY